MSPTGFVLTEERKKRLEKRPISYQQVRAVKQVKSAKPSHTTRNILIGVGVGVVVTFAALFAGWAASGGRV